jgi:hypothetical protein
MVAQWVTTVGIKPNVDFVPEHQFLVPGTARTDFYGIVGKFIQNPVKLQHSQSSGSTRG